MNTEATRPEEQGALSISFEQSLEAFAELVAGYEVHAVNDEQNGLDDDSAWIEAQDEGELREQFDAAGFETFEAPNDDGGDFFSTYGIPLESLSEIVPGDRVRLKDGHYGLVSEVEVRDDASKTKGFARQVLLKTDTGTQFLLTESTDSEGNAIGGAPIRLFHKHSSHGWAKHGWAASTFYRFPREEDA